MSFICNIHNYTEYYQQWNVCSAFNPSKCTHLEQWAGNTAAPGEQLGVRCLDQGSHLSRGQFLLESRFEPTTSGYKSNALSIRATTAPILAISLLKYIYIYAFSRHFYPKRLTIAFRLYIFISMCVPWDSNPQPFALLTQCSTTFFLGCFLCKKDIATMVGYHWE